MSHPVQGRYVHGNRHLSEETLAIVRAINHHEEKLLRALDDLAAMEDVDKRWLTTGRTDVEKGFMSIRRAIMRPDRVRLPGDSADD